MNLNCTSLRDPSSLSRFAGSVVGMTIRTLPGSRPGSPGAWQMPSQAQKNRESFRSPGFDCDSS